MKNRSLQLRLGAFFLFLLALPAAVAAQAPVVRKIEPPNWWTNFTPQLTLLLTGENLQDARVTSSTGHLSVLGSKPSSNGHYLFVYLKMDAGVRPAPAQFQIRTSSGTTGFQLPLLRRDNSPGLFQGFSPDDVIYLIMPDRFADGDLSNDRPPGSTGTYDRSQPMAYHGGDLRGIREHLPYLHDLGVTTLWLTPVWKNTDSDYHGYHVVDFYEIDDHMGSLQDYEDLVADAHKLGMKILIDFVANHTGPKHPWASDPPEPDWFHGSPEHHLDAVYKFLSLVDPHATEQQRKPVLEGWFANRLPDLNPDNPDLAQYLLQNAAWWTETARLDGFRLDTFPYSSRKFWSGWHQNLFRIYPDIKSVGEVSAPDPVITSFFEGGRPRFDGVDSEVTTVFDFPLFFALRDVLLHGQPVQKIIDVLRQDCLYPRPDELVTFIGNHDQPRFMGEPGSSVEELKAAFALLLTMRGTPQLYAGDEIAMPGGNDPDNRRDFRGGFPGDTRNAFVASGRTPDEQEVFSHVRQLLHLRQAHPALEHGRQENIGWDDGYFAFVRETHEEKLLVIVNNASTTRNITVSLRDTSLEASRRVEKLFGAGQAELNEGLLRSTLPSKSLSIYTAK